LFAAERLSPSARERLQVDVNDQPLFIAADVEDCEFTHLVGARVYFANVGKFTRE
jgi:hypothetical protein